MHFPRFQLEGFSKRQDKFARSRALSMIVLVCWLALSAGCAQWSKENTATEEFLPKLKKPPDTVVVETVLVRYPKAKSKDFARVWDTVDETYFGIESRQALDRNGVRMGLLIGELPQVIREQIAITSHDQANDVLEHAGLAADADNKTRRLQCRAGRRKELFVRRELGEPLTVLTNLNGEAQGEVYERAVVLFDLRAFPKGNKQVLIKLTPEIQHGETKHSYVSSDFGVRPEARRERKTWPELAIETNLSPGQIFVMSGTTPSKALGKAFFSTRTADQTDENVILLLRVLETQVDELFAPETVVQAQAAAEN
ncbi:MAG: hypothetical protein AAF483_08170 [Planctomycetota bacterium]